MMKYKQGLFLNYDELPAVGSLVSWIPIKIAKIDSWYEIEGFKGNWKLSKLYNIEIDENTLKKMKNAYRTQRKVSDI